MADDDVDARKVMFAHLDASRRFLETANPFDCAVELVTQGLDIVPPSERWAVLTKALDEFDDDEHDALQR